MIYIAIWLLTLFDAAATYIGVTRFGLPEGNPFMLWLFGWSIPGACILAVIVTTAMLFVVRRYRPHYRWIGWALIGVLAIKIAVAGLHVVWIAMI